MANPIRQLPHECRELIKGYASDKLPPTATAMMIKKLQFDYMPIVNEPVYWPLRLVVKPIDPDDDERMRFHTTSKNYSDRRRRQYMLHDFLLSYWSDYANTYDFKVYDDHDLLRLLLWE